MDAQELLVFNGDLACAVVGRGEDFMLIRLDGDIDSATDAALAKGFDFAGVVAVVRGQAVAKCQPGLDAMRVMMSASLAYARLVVDELKGRRGDSAEWLQRLWELPDTRTEL